MYKQKSIIAVIPARGGSKGLPGKNIRTINGKPLLAWSIEKAKLCPYLDCICVSTDSREIAQVANDWQLPVPFLRPAELASDTASTFQAIEHALGFYREQGREFDYVVLLEPTSPLRENDDIGKIIEKMESLSQNFDSIVSIGEVTTEHPSIVKKLEGDTIIPYCPDLALTTRRQDNPPAYFPYGVAYMAKTVVYLKEQTFYTKRCAGFPIKRYQNYEIDDLYDFICVENIMKHQWA